MTKTHPVHHRYEANASNVRELETNSNALRKPLSNNQKFHEEKNPVESTTLLIYTVYKYHVARGL